MALSYSGITGSVRQSKRTIKKISNIVSTSTVTKANLSNSITRYRTQRLEDQRRQQTSTAMGGPVQVLRRGGAKNLSLSAAGGSLASRLVGFIGYVSAGWILSNMPTWISGAKQLKGRIDSLDSSITGIGYDLNTFMGDMSTLTSSLYSNLKSKDFKDDSKLVSNSMGELNDTVSSLGDKLSHVFSTLLQPLTNLTPLGTKGETGAYPDAAKASGGTGEQVSVSSGNLSETQKQALSILSKYESASAGNYNAVNQIGTKGGRGVKGYSGDFRKMTQHGGKALTDMTIAEIMELQAKRPGMSDDEWIRQGRLHAVGRYQFIGGTLPGVVKRSGIPTSAKFSPEVQDVLAMQYLKEVGIGAWVGPSDKATAQERAIIDRARKEPIKPPTVTTGTSNTQVASTSSSTPTATPTTAAVSSSGGSSNTANALAKTAERLQKERLDTSRYGGNGCVFAVNEVYRAAGITPVWGTANYVPTVRGILVAKKWLQVSTKDAKPGDIVIMLDTHPTEPWVHIGIVSTQGTVIHNSSTNQALTNNESFSSLVSRYVKIEVFRDPNGATTTAPTSTTTSSPSATLVPTASTAALQTGGSNVDIQSNSNAILAGVLEGLKTEVKGPEVVLINDLQQSQDTSSSGGSSGGSGGGSSSSLSEGDVVNMYIKQKLLLDLNYL